MQYENIICTTPEEFRPSPLPRGGARPGAGRPTTGRTVRLCVRISPDVAQMLDTLAISSDNKTAVITQLIREAYARHTSI